MGLEDILLPGLVDGLEKAILVKPQQPSAKTILPGKEIPSYNLMIDLSYIPSSKDYNLYQSYFHLFICFLYGFNVC